MKQIKLKRAWGELEAKYCFQRQSWPKYMRQTSVLVWNNAPREKFNFSFWTVFRLYWQNFHFGRNTGHQAIILWRIGIFLKYFLISFFFFFFLFLGSRSTPVFYSKIFTVIYICTYLIHIPFSVYSGMCFYIHLILLMGQCLWVIFKGNSRFGTITIYIFLIL